MQHVPMEPEDDSLEGLTVQRDEESHRYELREGGRRIGLIDYHERRDAVVMTHTEVDRDQQRRGLGSLLVAGALDDVRARGRGVVPDCLFVASFIAAHPEYRDLVVTP